MNPSYSMCTFRLHLPQCIYYGDNLDIAYKFEYKKNQAEKIIFYKAIIIDKVNYTLVDENSLRMVCVSKMPQKVSLSFHQGKKKLLLRGARLKLYFLSQNECTEVLFEFINNEHTALLDVSKRNMTQEELNDWILLEREKENIYADANAYFTSNQSKHTEAHPIRRDSLYKYKQALKTEKIFLMNAGGKKYKVTSGKLVSSKNGIFYYVFDLETELHIADDTPVKIELGGQFASGSVVMCEDFQIIIQTNANMGERVGTAWIHVEPWKLLEALEKKVENLVVFELEKTKEPVSKLVNIGPTLGTSAPVEQIPKGQDAVIRRATKDPVCIVWGPPGTGKTHTMSQIAIKFMEQGKTVLIVSHSNVSVDGVAKKIGELLVENYKDAVLKEGKVLRYGYIRDEELGRNQYISSFLFAVSKNAPLQLKLENLQKEYDKEKYVNGIESPKIIEIRKKINVIRSQIRDQEKHYVERARVVTTTVSKIIIDSLFENKKYDVVMFDEVSMAYVLQVVCAASFAREHVICVGDFMQLAPIAQSNAKNILCEDIFAYLGINQHGKPCFHPWLVMLNEQRRMHPQISKFANRQVYSGLLKDHLTVYTGRNNIVEAELFKNQPINLIDLAGSYCAASKNADNSRYNILSALISFSIAIKTEQNVKNVSIITPYAAQTRLIRALVLDYRQGKDTKMRCSTIHQFQGSESDVVVFDAVESYPSKKTGWLMGKDFNSILRLINVAVTRAKGKLVTVANVRFWNENYKGTSHTFYRLIKYLTEEGNTIQHAKTHELGQLAKNLTSKNGPAFYLEPEEYMDTLHKDIMRAKEKIVISLPTGELEAKHETIVLEWLEEKIKAGVAVLIKCNGCDDLPPEWKKYTLKTDNAVFPIIMIDKKITWYGVPYAKWKFSVGIDLLTVCPIVCRIRGEHTAEMILSLCDLDYCTDGISKGLMTPVIGKMGTSEITKTGLETGGLPEYVKKNKRCSRCKKPLSMTRGKSGKVILWCKDCHKSELLPTVEVNQYICMNHIWCPEHKCHIEAKVGSYGLYIKCDAGHSIKPEYI